MCTSTVSTSSWNKQTKKREKKMVKLIVEIQLILGFLPVSFRLLHPPPPRPPSLLLSFSFSLTLTKPASSHNFETLIAFLSPQPWPPLIGKVVLNSAQQRKKPEKWKIKLHRRKKRGEKEGQGEKCIKHLPFLTASFGSLWLINFRVNSTVTNFPLGILLRSKNRYREM